MSSNSMSPYVTYLSALREVSDYAVDLRLVEEDEAIFLRPFKISQDDFFSQLYQEREVEGELLRKLQTSSGMIVLVGSRGSGKTCLGLKMKRMLEAGTAYRSFISFIDIRVEGFEDILGTHNPQAFKEQLLERMKNSYLGELFRYEEKEVGGRILNPLLWLRAYLLKASPEMPSKIFHVFTPLQNKAAELYDTYVQESGSGTEVDYYEWLLRTHKNQKKVKKLIRRLESKIGVSHLVYAARYLYEFQRQYLWIDNIDILPDQLQAELQRAITLVHARVSDYVGTVVAVRDENVFKDYDLEEEGAPPHETFVRFYSKSSSSIPSFDVPSMTTNELKEIIHKRLNFTAEYHKRRLANSDARINDVEDRLKEIDNKRQESALKYALEELKKEKENFGPTVSKQQLSEIRQVSDKLLDTMERLGAIHLANNSLRYLLRIHSDCLEQLFVNGSNIEKTSSPPALTYESWYISTLFLAWIRYTTSPDHHIGFYDIIHTTAEWHASRKKSLGCFLHYLVITATWNMTLKRRISNSRQYRIPSVHNLVSQLELIGYSRNEVIEALHSLYHQGTSRNSIVEIQSKTKHVIRESSDIDDDCLIYVTSRGKCLAGIVGNTFGYLYQCVKHHKAQDVLNSDQWTSELTDTYSATKEILPYLYDIAKMHISGMQEIKNSGSIEPEDFMSKYYAMFGLPLRPPYARRMDFGLVVGGGRRALYLEALIEGIIAYIPRRHNDLLKHLNDLLKSYKSSIEQVASGDSEILPIQVPSDFASRLSV